MPIPFIGAAISAVASIVTTIGPAVATFCTTVLPRILPVLAKGAQILGQVASVVQAFSEIHGILRHGESVSDIGDRALQAAGKIHPDQFDDFDQYLQALRNFPLDPGKSQSFDGQTKFVAGLGVVAGGLDQKFRVRGGTMANLWALIAVPDYFTAERLGAIVARTGEIANVIKYFDGTLMPADAMRIEQILIDAEKAAFPGKSDDACEQTLSAARAQMRAAAT